MGERSTRRLARPAAGLVVAALLTGGLAAQDQRPQFSSSVQLVEVYATVTDARGELVTGLRQSDFDVFEDGARQDVSAFASGEFPLTVALGVDRSWSMAGDRLRLAKQASQSFLRQLTPSDRSMVLAISNEADVIAPLSTDRLAQSRAIAALDPWSTTALHDAIIAALDRLDPEPGRQALIVFSDGADRYSAPARRQVIERARRSNALIYPDRLRPRASAAARGAGRRSPAAARSCCATPRSWKRRSRRSRASCATSISLATRRSTRLVRGEREWRSIRVAVKGQRPGLRVRARDGYTTE